MRAPHTLPSLLLALMLAGTAIAAPKPSPVTPDGAPGTRVLAPPVNDQCSGAILLLCGNIVLSGNTEQATNDYAFSYPDTSCTGFATNGRDVVYKLNVGVGDSLWIDYTNRVDGSIYLVTDCGDVDGTCVAGADLDSDPNTTESLRYKFTSSGLYYLILDSYTLDTGDLWTANGQLICGSQTPPSNDLCENATPLTCGPFNLSGSTEFAHNNMDFGGPNICTPKASGGRDVAYKLTVAAGDSLWVNYTSHTKDGSVYVVADCNDIQNSCIWGEDWNGVGDPEPFRYKFTFSGVYYLIFDSVEPDSWSTWNAVGGLICANPPPPNDRCDIATVQPCGDFNWAGTTQYAINNYFFLGNDVCTGYPADGRDVVYRFDVHQNDTLTVNYRSITSDGTMYLVTDCANPALSCVAGADVNYTGEYEQITYIFPSNGTYYLILDTVDFNSWSSWTAYGHYGCSTTDVDPGAPAVSLALREISPNPSFGRTSISYQLPATGPVTLRVYDLQGRVHRTLVDGERQAGQHQVQWDGRDDRGQPLSAGIYFARLSSGASGAVKRVIFVR